MSCIQIKATKGILFIVQHCVGCTRCSSCSAAEVNTWINIPKTQIRLPTSPAKLSDIPTTLSTETLAEGGKDTTLSKSFSEGEEESDEDVQVLGLCTKCLDLRAKENYCPLCQGCYEDDDYDARMMECGRCKEWIHAHCEGLTNEHYQILSCLPDSVEYVCRLCLGADKDNYLNPIMGELKAGMELVLDGLMASKSARHLVRRKVPHADSSKSIGMMPSCSGQKTDIVTVANETNNEVESKSLKTNNQIDKVGTCESNSSAESTQHKISKPIGGTNIISSSNESDKVEENRWKSVSENDINSQKRLNDARDPKALISKDIDDDAVSSDDSSYCHSDSDLESITDDSEEPRDLISIKEHLTEHKYDTVLQFHLDVTKVIDGGKYFSCAETRNLFSSYEYYMKDCFGWFDVNDVNIFDLIDRAHLFPRPSSDHSYAISKTSHNASLSTPEFKDSQVAKQMALSPSKSRLPMIPCSPEPIIATGFRRCVLCSKFSDCPAEMEGRLVYLGQDEWLHVNCALWSSEVFEESDGRLQKVYEAVSRGRMIKCQKCNERGATLGCCHRNCSVTYHFKCALLGNCQFLQDKRMFCPNHHLSENAVVMEDFDVDRRVYVDRSGQKRKNKQVLSSKVSVTIGSLTIHSLGKILPNLDSSEALIPVDFVCSRMYWSTIDPRKRVRYICKTKRVVDTEEEDCDDEKASHMVIDHSKDKATVDKEMQEMKAWFKRVEDEKIAQMSRETNVIPPHLCPLYRNTFKQQNSLDVGKIIPKEVSVDKEANSTEMVDGASRRGDEENLLLDSELPGIVNSVDNELISMVLNDLEDEYDGAVLQPLAYPLSQVDLDFLANLNSVEMDSQEKLENNSSKEENDSKIKVGLQSDLTEENEHIGDLDAVLESQSRDGTVGYNRENIPSESPITPHVEDVLSKEINSLPHDSFNVSDTNPIQENNTSSNTDSLAYHETETIKEVPDDPSLSVDKNVSTVTDFSSPSTSILQNRTFNENSEPGDPNFIGSLPTPENICNLVSCLPDSILSPNIDSPVLASCKNPSLEFGSGCSTPTNPERSAPTTHAIPTTTASVFSNFTGTKKRKVCRVLPMMSRSHSVDSESHPTPPVIVNSRTGSTSQEATRDSISTRTINKPSSSTSVDETPVGGSNESQLANRSPKKICMKRKTVIKKYPLRSNISKGKEPYQTVQIEIDETIEIPEGDEVSRKRLKRKWNTIVEEDNDSTPEKRITRGSVSRNSPSSSDSTTCESDKPSKVSKKVVKFSDDNNDITVSIVNNNNLFSSKSQVKHKTTLMQLDGATDDLTSSDATDSDCSLEFESFVIPQVDGTVDRFEASEGDTSDVKTEGESSLALRIKEQSLAHSCPGDSGPYKCDKCKRLYRTKESYERHIETCTFEIDSSTSDDEECIDNSPSAKVYPNPEGTAIKRLQSTTSQEPPSKRPKLEPVMGVKKSMSQKRYGNVKLVKGSKGYEYKKGVKMLPYQVNGPQQINVKQFENPAQPIQINIPAFTCPSSSAPQPSHDMAPRNISHQNMLVNNPVVAPSPSSFTTNSFNVETNASQINSLQTAPISHNYSMQYLPNQTQYTDYQSNPVLIHQAPQQSGLLQPQLVQQIVQQPVIQSNLLTQNLVSNQIVMPQMMNQNITYAFDGTKTVLVNQPLMQVVSQPQTIIRNTIPSFQSSQNQIIQSMNFDKNYAVVMNSSNVATISSQAPLKNVQSTSVLKPSSKPPATILRPKGPFYANPTTVRNVATVAPAMLSTTTTANVSCKSVNKFAEQATSIADVEYANDMDKPRPTYSYRDAMNRPIVPNKVNNVDLPRKGSQCKPSYSDQKENIKGIANKANTKEETQSKVSQSYKLVLNRDINKPYGINIVPPEGEKVKLMDHEVKELRIKAKVSLGPKRKPTIIPSVKNPNQVSPTENLSLNPENKDGLVMGHSDVTMDGLVNEQVANMTVNKQTPGSLVDDPKLFDKPKWNSGNKSEPYIVFELTSEDGFKVESRHMSEVWQTVFDAVSSARSSLKMQTQTDMPRAGNGSVTGLNMLGLTHNAVQYLLEQLPGSNDCQKYSFQFHRRNRDDSNVLGSVSGCARTEAFKFRSPYDLFSWLASQHRALPETDVLTPQEEIQLSNRRATSLELPMAMRYRHLKETAREAVGVFRSGIHGRGLFCKRDIDCGEMVIEYAGQMIRASLCDIREKFYESKGIGCYMFRIDDDIVVDATMHGNAARFINHSCDPNCYSRVVDILGKKHIIIFALRRIIRGEELTYDYKFPIEDEKIPCSCGAKRCRKTLN